MLLHASLAAMAAASRAACPDCEVGRLARDLVISDAFVTHAWYAVLPFLVSAFVVRRIAHHLDARSRR